MLELNHTDNLFEKKGGGKGNSKGNHSSAEENGKLPLTLTGEHSTQASWTNPLNWIYIPAAAVTQKKDDLVFHEKETQVKYNSILLIFIKH